MLTWQFSNLYSFSQILFTANAMQNKKKGAKLSLKIFLMTQNAPLQKPIKYLISIAFLHF